jgi:hypothetical protein
MMIRKIATSTSLQMVGLAISIGDRIVLGALMLRLWGVPVFEDWSILLAAAGLMTLLDLGLNMTFSNAYTSAYQKRSTCPLAAVDIDRAIRMFGHRGSGRVVFDCCWRMLQLLEWATCTV